MKEIRATKPHNLGQLLEELEANVPALRAVDVGGERQAVMSVTGKGDDILVLVPDDVDGASVTAVIAAHVARPPVPPPDLKALALASRSSIQAATTLPQLKAALVNDLFPLLRAIAKGSRGDLDGA